MRIAGALIAVLLVGCAQSISPSAPPSTRSSELSSAPPTVSPEPSPAFATATPPLTESPSAPPVCPGALLEGVLVQWVVEVEKGPQFGVDDDGVPGSPVTSVIWPSGYRARFHDQLLVLEDLSGNVKAREGDHVRLGGGSSSSGFIVCGELEIVAPTPTPVGQLPLWTSPPPPRWSMRPEAGICDLALISGIVARHPNSVLGLRGRRSNKVAPLFWPFGYTSREEQGVIVLVDPHGTVVAREGDRVEMGGGLNVEGETEACGWVEVVGGKE